MNNRKFQTLLGNYFDGGWMNRADGLISVFFPAFVYDKNAVKLLSAFHKSSLPPAAETSQTISIPFYDGNNAGILRMIEELKPLQTELIAAFVHGSFATGEAIPYSDFDGLLIVRDEVFEDKIRLVNLAKAIYESRRIMHSIDPLQHHGWFVLTERDLLAYPVTYLPLEVLNHARSLLPSSDVDLRVKVMKAPDYFTPVKTMCRRIRKMTHGLHQPKSMYQLKSLMSEFMLLPALYIQARDQRGIFKKLSFAAAAADFNLSVWSIMDEVSRMRAEWPEFNSHSEIKKFRKIGYIWIQYRKRKGPAIPAVFASRLNNDFYHRMAELANQVEVNLFR